MNIEGYPLARLHFFRELSEAQRRQILVNLGAIDDSYGDAYCERMTQGIEMRLLDWLVEQGKLDELKKAISIEQLRVFQLDEFEWWVGASLAETVAAAKEYYGGEKHGYQDARELSEAELDKFTFYGDENQTFRQRLEIVKKSFVAPAFFAITEA